MRRRGLICFEWDEFGLYPWSQAEFTQLRSSTNPANLSLICFEGFEPVLLLARYTGIATSKPLHVIAIGTVRTEMSMQSLRYSMLGILTLNVVWLVFQDFGLAFLKANFSVLQLGAMPKVAMAGAIPMKPA